ncbi:MAG: tyrosine-type recombinase/integrase [Acidobacteriales bacterium]|nr:tyrosine-type recombinase/integrase [Terriglobales bacterium]
MITQFFPKDFQRYQSLPVLGPLMDSFAAWLHDQRYTWRSSRYELRMAAHVCEYLKRRAVRRIEDLTEEHLQACHRLFRRKFPKEEGSVRVLQRFLCERGWVQAAAAPEPSRTDIHLQAFRDHLQNTRGYAPSTVQRQVTLAAEFPAWLNFEKAPEQLSSLSLEEVDEFFRRLGKRLGRVAMQKPIATLRNFLRFLAAGGVVAPGLDSQIETPRIYRQEQLPRALPWPTVQAFLRSINRDLASGKRDYAIFTLMATYGLRACDIVALTLDDIHWRAGRIRLCQGKTGQPLELPLTDPVGSAILDYLRKVPRYGAYRHVFLRLKAPGGALKSTAVTEAFQAWSKRSGLEIPFQGTHCIRHYAESRTMPSGSLINCRNAIP